MIVTTAATMRQSRYHTPAFPARSATATLPNHCQHNDTNPTRLTGDGSPYHAQAEACANGVVMMVGRSVLAKPQGRISSA